MTPKPKWTAAPPVPDKRSPGRFAYERYRDRWARAGRWLPEWCDLEAIERDAWECAATEDE